VHSPCSIPLWCRPARGRGAPCGRPTPPLDNHTIALHRHRDAPKQTRSTGSPLLAPPLLTLPSSAAPYPLPPLRRPQGASASHSPFDRSAWSSVPFGPVEVTDARIIELHLVSIPCAVLHLAPIPHGQSSYTTKSPPHTPTIGSSMTAKSVPPFFSACWWRCTGREMGSGSTPSWGRGRASPARWRGPAAGGSVVWAGERIAQPRPRGLAHARPRGRRREAEGREREATGVGEETEQNESLFPTYWW
jgi:hypothetical protein